MLTAIRGDQIKLEQLHNGHVVGPTHSKFGGGVHHEKLNLGNSIVASFLHNDESVHRAVLDSHLLALWDVALGQAVSGTSMDVTTVIEGTASTDSISTLGTTAKGILTTGTGGNGAGTGNYRVQIRDSSTKDPIHDFSAGGQVYGELTNSSIGTKDGNYTLSFKKADGTPYTMAVAETSKITALADVLVENPATGSSSPTFHHSLNGKYFQISSPTTDYYVWYHVSGESSVDPASLNAGRTAVPITLSPLVDATAVATVTATALNALPGFSASSSLAIITVTCAAPGVPLNFLRDGKGGKETGFGFEVTTRGSPTQIDFMFIEIFSYLTAPALAYTNGVGFADIIGVAGSHNHHELYYTKIELESGQLDDRYFTKTQLNAGQLDNRYYTENEVDPVPGTDSGTAKLDTRYFKRNEITSTANGSSGAGQVGVTATGELSSSNVQAALLELQGDIDGILNGSIDIQHSLDDAYDDGSVVAVDATNVDWQLTNTKKFKVTSSTGSVDVFKVEAEAVGNKVAILGDLNVTGPTKLVGGLDQSSGSVKVAATTVDIDGTNVTIDGTADSSLATTSANLTVETKTSGNLTVRSASGLLLKDVNLGSALPLSQTGVTGLSARFNTAASIVGAINENESDLYNFINVTLPAQTDGASGADQVGATGITGVIPTGGTLGSHGTVQSMLEGIALGSAGGKVFPSMTGTASTGNPITPGSLIEEKVAGMYFKSNEIVYVRDINRFVIIRNQGLSAVEGTDWDYIWGANAAMAGPSFNVATTNVAFDVTGSVAVDADSGIVLRDDSGAKVELTAAGMVDIDAALGQKIALYSNTEIEINGGALVDIDATAITIDGQLTATGAANQNMIIQTTGTGQVQLKAADEIDLTGGNIELNAGAGKTVVVNSDTEIELNSALVDINGSATVTIDAPAIQTTGILTQTGNTQIIGDMDFDGAIDHDGASFDSTVSGAFNVTADSAKVVASGATLELNTDGAVNVLAAPAQTVTVTTTGLVDLNAGTLDIDVTGAATLDAASIAATAAANGNIIVTTSGMGIIDVYSESRIDVTSPMTQIYGDVVIVPEGQLSVDKIHITSVDPNDTATITGERSGTINPVNLLRNPGFEEGSGTDAQYWVEGPNADRVTSERYYGSYSINKLNATAAPAGESLVLEQAVNGDLVDDGDYFFSVYARGTVAKPIMLSLGGGTAVQLVPSGSYTNWTRFGVTVVAGSADEKVKLFVVNAGGELSDFFLDAAMLETGTGPASAYFTNYFSNLVFTIGDDDDDQIIFRSEGTATQDLVRIHQDHIFIHGNLEVTGTTTTINTQDLLVSDNNIVLNKDVVGTPALDAFYTVNRGDLTDAQIKWNESLDKWELFNHQSNAFETIVTSATGDTTVSLEAAYKGGSEVNVDNTNVVWTLGASKTFVIGDAVDANKFVVKGGTTADSIKIDTTGGVDIDVDAGFRVDENSGSYINMETGGHIAIYAAAGKASSIYGNDSEGVIGVNQTGQAHMTSWNNTDPDAISLNAQAGGIDINANAAKPITLDSGSFSIDGVLASNVSVTGANLNLSTLTSGTVDIDGATSVTIDAPAIQTTGILTQTGATQIIGDLDLDGSFDQTGNYTFLIDTTATAANAVRINSAGGVDIDAASAVTVDATNINTTGVLLQTGATQVVGDMNLDGSIDSDGEDIDIAAFGTGGTHLKLSSADAASITSVGMTLQAGTGSFTAAAQAASSVNVTGANLTLGTTTSGIVALNSASSLTFKDSVQTNAIPFSQTLANGFAAEFAYNSQSDFDWTARDTGTAAITSVMGALNANREDLYEYVELLSTQGAAVGVAAGANLIGVDGITGVMPMNSSFVPTGAAGADANLQEILNGLATSSGGGRVYADEAAFLAAKASNTYFKLYEHIRILDTSRTVVVLTQSTATVRETDWDYLYDASRAVKGAEYYIDTTSTINLKTVDFDITTTTFDVVASGAVLVDGASSVTLDAVTNVVLTAGATMDMDAVTFKMDGTTMDIDLLGAYTMDSRANSIINVTGGSLTLSTQTSGDISIASVGNIVETATVKQTQVTTFDVDATGAFTVDGGANSFVRTTGANLAIQTIGSGDIQFKSAIMPAAIPLTDGANSTLVAAPGSAAIASIFDAINRAYNNTGDTSKMSYYEAPTLTSTDAANNWIQVSDDSGLFDGVSTEAGTQNTGTGYNGQHRYDLPGGTSATLPALYPEYQNAGNISVTPSQLRNNYGIFVSIYLNGLRLSDSEWVYLYDSTSGKKIISFVNNHSTSDFTWSTVNAVDAIALSTSDHIVIECTFNRSGQA